MYRLGAFLILVSCTSYQKIKLIQVIPDTQACYSVGMIQSQSIDGSYDQALIELKKKANDMNATHLMILKRYTQKVKDSLLQIRKIYILGARAYECDIK